MLRHGDWDLLNKYHQYWFVTITPYGKDIEPNVPEKAAVMESFRSLSRIVGADCMCWRYDPILIDNTWTAERHIREFSAMCQKLEGSTHTCVISFIDLYEKVRRNYPEAKTVPFETQMSLTESFVKTAAGHGMTIKPCGEDKQLAITGADCSGCMTQETFESAIGQNINLPPNPNNRKECSCYITNDIGQYNTCGHLCRYCYANADAGTVRRNMRMHDPKSPLLVGFPRPEDRIRDARQESFFLSPREEVPFLSRIASSSSSEYSPLFSRQQPYLPFRHVSAQLIFSSFCEDGGRPSHKIHQSDSGPSQ